VPVCALALCAVTAAGAATLPVARAWSEPIEIVGPRANDAALRASCGLYDVTRTTRAFFAALNRRDVRAAMRKVAPDSDLAWFTQNIGVGGVADNGGRDSRADVARYLRRRVDRSERLRLIMIKAKKSGSSVHAQLMYQRTATDIGAWMGGRLHVADGKAEFSCHNKRLTIAVWSSGMADAPNAGIPASIVTPCPAPKSWRPFAAVLACR
jgi:limonene-1,2-epoxide hydrolase